MKIKALLLALILASCSNSNELILDVEIKDLKKGKLVLSKINDSVFSTIDSFNVSGEKNIIFKNELNEPELLFLELYTNQSKDPFSLEDDYYLSVGLNSNIKESDFARKKLNLVVVLDISGSMSRCSS